MTRRKRRLYLESEQGFTLIEFSMVLVIIGLILGMIFKGKGLIDQAKNKSIQAQIYKIQMAVETFRQQYGYWPADGCTQADTQYCGGKKDGLLDKASEQYAFWTILISHHLLSEQDRTNSFGKPWQVRFQDREEGRGGHYLSTHLPLSQICLLDRQLDDGGAATGVVQADIAYEATTPCESLSKTDMPLYVLLS